MFLREPEPVLMGLGRNQRTIIFRWSDPGYLSSNAPKNVPVPLYDSELNALSASHVLIVAEKGVDDEVMYLSGARGLIDAGINVSVSCDPRLVSAFHRTVPGGEWISRLHLRRLDLIWITPRSIDLF